MTKNEALTKLDDYSTPFLFWGSKGDCMIGCDDLIIRFNHQYGWPEEGKEKGLEFDKIYYPSLISSRIEQVFEDCSVELYPYRRRNSQVVETNPLELDVGATILRKICKKRLKQSYGNRGLIVNELDDEKIELDVGKLVIANSDLVDIAEAITGDGLDGLKGKAYDGYVSLKSDEYSIVISGEVDQP